jgi:hypothetical protein
MLFVVVILGGLVLGFVVLANRLGWFFDPDDIRGKEVQLDETGAYVRRPFPSWNRSILTEISLCHTCSCQEILRTETAGQALEDELALAPPPPIPARPSA